LRKKVIHSRFWVCHPCTKNQRRKCIRKDKFFISKCVADETRKVMFIYSLQDIYKNIWSNVTLFIRCIFSWVFRGKMP